MPHSAVWYPYCQMQNLTEPPEVISGKGAWIHLKDGSRLLDATSAWWCLIHGYRHPDLDAALHRQIDQLSHVMLGGLTHQPALQLAEKLVGITPAPLTRVFFSDSGSVGVEVAIKMAVQYQKQQGQAERTHILAVKQAYHGDTSGCMAVCDPEEGMHQLFKGWLMEHPFTAAPRAGFDALPDDPLLQQDLQILQQSFEQHHQQLAAFIVEPLLQAAGGFNMYSPLWLQEVRRLCDHYGILLILDEVATGFGRTGKLFACEHAAICPDILVLSKGLTGGYLGLAATLATEKVFEGFYGGPAQAFMHGPTFMGNPLACSVALASIEVFERDHYLQRIAMMQQQLQQALDDFQAPGVVATRTLGATGVIEVDHADRLKGMNQWARAQGVWLRPFGRYAYTMPCYVISDEELLTITRTMKKFFTIQ
ncbi:adenosylmethionine--8-amino-7-oxononanoate transaminase [Marinospirillum alkaliphilum]|uniref:Adenosylmethionine-8-amino-7-oxononanoate aminotransferase n=1 Tax=Marinospirillum alkaliphilum DSM 21637 TaxID=1122209 RepID=A0A1K1TCN6_9GAMM|nr:adenosylmethionine--8-amino-7-oxononanoate transaminase [Marinospirillum alkaliphilum]SFW98401.1 adenosylmethionine-8-amino-7-oxononanoate aminotransferase [Marinospirillum alkaliphilum DSM 21637]